jgi:hypothetical protein
MRSWTSLPQHIDYATDCLTAFLRDIQPEPVPTK